MIPLLASLPTEIFGVDQIPDPADDRWIMQPKIDGHRIIIDYRGDEPKILNRNGVIYSAGPFRLTVPDVFMGYVVDGEYLPKHRLYFAFDLLKYPEDDDVNYQRIWHSRRSRLEAVIGMTRDPVSGSGLSYHALPYDKTWDVDDLKYARCFQHLDRTVPVDGVVFKKNNTYYLPGRTIEWLKYKFTNDVDVYVSELNIDNKANCALSIYDPLSDTEFPVGKASTSGKGKITIGTVVTVRFLQFTAKGRLREPRIVQIRDDKRPVDCTIDQLIPFMPNT